MTTFKEMIDGILIHGSTTVVKRMAQYGVNTLGNSQKCRRLKLPGEVADAAQSWHSFKLEYSEQLFF